MAEKTTEQVKPIKAKFEIHYPENLNIVYTNHTEFMMSNMDLIIDFGIRESHIPDFKKGTIPALMNTRVIMSPQHAKEVAIKLSGLIKIYERDFGTIQLKPKQQ